MAASETTNITHSMFFFMKEITLTRFIWPNFRRILSCDVIVLPINKSIHMEKYVKHYFHIYCFVPFSCLFSELPATSLNLTFPRVPF